MGSETPRVCSLRKQKSTDIEGRLVGPLSIHRYSRSLLQPIVWTPKLVRRLEATEDKITCAVDHWLYRLIGGFITEFMIDTTVSYSEAERQFLQGLWGKYIKSLNS